MNCLLGPIVKLTTNKFIIKLSSILSKHDLYHVCNFECIIKNFIIEHSNNENMCIIDYKYNF